MTFSDIRNLVNLLLCNRSPLSANIELSGPASHRGDADTCILFKIGGAYKVAETSVVFDKFADFFRSVFSCSHTSRFIVRIVMGEGKKILPVLIKRPVHIDGRQVHCGNAGIALDAPLEHGAGAAHGLH